MWLIRDLEEGFLYSQSSGGSVSGLLLQMLCSPPLRSVPFVTHWARPGEIASDGSSTEEAEPEWFNDFDISSQLAGSHTNQNLIQSVMVLLHAIASKDKKQKNKLPPLGNFP